MLQALFERVLLDHRIWIQKENKLASTLSDGLVVGHRKPHIFGIHNDLYPRKTALNHGH